MPNEQTILDPLQETLFQRWAQQSGIKDLDQAPYDYRGFFEAHGPVKYKWLADHLPDTWKMHGHETFSQESKYSTGPSDGGMWKGEQFIPQPAMAPSHEQDTRTLLLAMLKRK
jgi:hypothetical protein